MRNCRAGVAPANSFVGASDALALQSSPQIAVTCASSLAQDKATLQANATVAGILQGSADKSVELHLRSGEKMGGKVAQVTDSIVHLSNLTGAEYFDAFIDMKDVSAVVVGSPGS